MITLGDSHGIILCTHILPEVQAVCNRVQIINQGKLVYSSGIDELLNKQGKQYEFSLATAVDQQALANHEAFSTVEQVEDNCFIVDSELSAEQLTEYIVQQRWGLTRFAPRQTSLEQIFIDLTAGDIAVAEKDTVEHSR
jgi:ABC-2 type transport system ATP-binding protein